MTDAGGSNLQVQWNNAGVLDGMAGTNWDATDQRLSITEAPSVYGAAAVSITKGAGSSSVLELGRGLFRQGASRFAAYGSSHVFANHVYRQWRRDKDARVGDRIRRHEWLG